VHINEQELFTAIYTFWLRIDQSTNDL